MPWLIERIMNRLQCDREKALRILRFMEVYYPPDCGWSNCTEEQINESMSKAQVDVAIGRRMPY